MEYEEAASVSRLMLKFVADFAQADLSEEQLYERCAQELVMISGHHTDPRARCGEIGYPADYIAAGIIPRPFSSPAPAVDKISEDIQLIWLILIEKAGGLFRVCITKAEMEVTQEQRADADFSVRRVVHWNPFRSQCCSSILAVDGSSAVVRAGFERRVNLSSQSGHQGSIAAPFAAESRLVAAVAVTGVAS